MPLRKARADLVKVTANVFLSDWKWAKSVYDKVGASTALREAFHKFRLETEKEMRAARIKPEGDLEL